jgi:hypothetical protein
VEIALVVLKRNRIQVKGRHTLESRLLKAKVEAAASTKSANEVQLLMRAAFICHCLNL